MVKFRSRQVKKLLARWFGLWIGNSCPFLLAQLILVQILHSYSAAHMVFKQTVFKVSSIIFQVIWAVFCSHPSQDTFLHQLAVNCEGISLWRFQQQMGLDSFTQSWAVVLCALPNAHEQSVRYYHQYLHRFRNILCTYASTVAQASSMLQPHLKCRYFTDKSFCCHSGCSCHNSLKLDIFSDGFLERFMCYFHLCFIAC